jgi:hypothetical protein
MLRREISASSVRDVESAENRAFDGEQARHVQDVTSNVADGSGAGLANHEGVNQYVPVPSCSDI